SLARSWASAVTSSSSRVAMRSSTYPRTLLVHVFGGRHRRDRAATVPAVSDVGAHSVSEPVAAATVVVVRDAAEGLEVLMLRRNARGMFGGMWVFPGGRV